MVVVTVSGPPGSGTSTAARLIADRLGVPFVSTGGIFRRMAKEHGMTLEAFGDHVDDHPEIDRELDDRQRRRAEEGDVVLEGRLSGLMTNDLPGALNVYLRCPAEERARRVARREDLTEEEAFEAVWTREGQEKARYLRVYGVDPDDTDAYDLVLDSGKLTAEEIADEVLEALGPRGRGGGEEE